MAASSKGSFAWTVNPSGGKRTEFPLGRPILFNSELYKENPSKPRRRARPHGYFPTERPRKITATWGKNPQRKIRPKAEEKNSWGSAVLTYAKRQGRLRRRSESNPAPRGRKNEPNIWVPSLAGLKKEGINSVLAAAGGFVDSNLLGMGAEMMINLWAEKKDKQPSENLTDIARIGTKFIGGSLLSYGVAKLTKNENLGAAHQCGVWASLILDVAGTLLKRALRAKDSERVRMGSPILPPLSSPISIGAQVLGCGEIYKAHLESTIRGLLHEHGRIDIMQDGDRLGIAHPTSGAIIMSGPSVQMQKIINGLKSWMVNGEAA